MVKFTSWPNQKKLQTVNEIQSKRMISVIEKEENNVGIEENVGYQHFIIFLQCFQKLSFLCGC